MRINAMSAELNEDLKLRHARMQSIMAEKGAEACILTGNANLSYAIGMVLDAYFYLPAEGEALLFTRKSLPVEGEGIFPISRPEQIPEILEREGYSLPVTIALEEDEISYREYIRLCNVFKNSPQIANANIARTARQIKTPYELNILRRDGKKHAAFYNDIPQFFDKNMTDLAFSARLEYELRLRGHLGIFRTFGTRMEAHIGTLLVGDNAAYPSPYDFSLGGQGTTPIVPLGPANKPIPENASIMVDLSGNYSGFTIDVTRCFSVGKAPNRAKELHQAAIEIMLTLAEMGKPGTPCNLLYEKAIEIVKAYKAEDCFMGLEKQAKFVGHGFGYEINELPVISARYSLPLEENMVIALEPKFIIPGFGAVGVEDSHIVGKNGFESITSGCPLEILPLD